jgi:hypothetical protein
MAVQFSDNLLDGFIAPGISSFTEALIPDLEIKYDQCRFWTSNFFLNCTTGHIFGSNFKETSKKYIVNLISRIQTCFFMYDKARSATYGYIGALTPGRPPIQKYFEALSFWESCIINMQVTYSLLQKFLEDNPYTTNDGSTIELICNMSNKIKHYSGDINSLCNIPDRPVWLSNMGLESSVSVLHFDKLAEELMELGEVANVLQSGMLLQSKADAATHAKNGKFDLLHLFQPHHITDTA